MYVDNILSGYVLFVLILYIIGMVIVHSMAKRRGYNSSPWVWLCLFVTPLAPIFILGCFIQTPEQYVNRQIMIRNAAMGIDEESIKEHKPVNSLKEWWQAGFIPNEPQNSEK